ncbi:hypothetical protein BV25DRAFT_396847 [Artomyces pyxidatus]|uniref:Uncharacterized protein n=1 Tax=Artomyces pyxidatus TaxID=48021 RepID=A0ACB8T529_9AGAM|nr:hypothetical protein BV25DRAFT_396847 [Artomyces pyxidatus]
MIRAPSTSPSQNSTRAASRGGTWPRAQNGISFLEMHIRTRICLHRACQRLSRIGECLGSGGGSAYACACVAASAPTGVCSKLQYSVQCARLGRAAQRFHVRGPPSSGTIATAACLTSKRPAPACRCASATAPARGGPSTSWRTRARVSRDALHSTGRYWAARARGLRHLTVLRRRRLCTPAS